MSLLPEGCLCEHQQPLSFQPSSPYNRDVPSSSSSCETRSCCMRWPQWACSPVPAVSSIRASGTSAARPIGIQMLSWWLKRLSLLIGACEGMTAQGERRRTNFDMETHICEPWTTLSTQKWTSRNNLPLSGMSSMLVPLFLILKDRESREGETWEKGGK